MIRKHAAKEFFQKLDFGIEYLAKKVSYGKKIFLIDTFVIEQEEQVRREQKMKRFLQNIKLGKIGLEVKKNYFFKDKNISESEDTLDEDTMEALTLTE